MTAPAIDCAQAHNTRPHMAKDLYALIPDRNGAHYTREQVVKAASDYVVIGSVQEVARRNGISDRAIYDWRKTEWWVELTSCLREENSDELDGALSGLIQDAVAAARDRIQNGDHKLLKMKGEGGDRVELVRVPVSAKDAAITAAVALDKRQLLRNLPTQITESGSGLRALQEQLRQLSGRTIEGKVLKSNED